MTATTTITPSTPPDPLGHRKRIPTSQPIKVLAAPLARQYTHIHPILLLSLFCLAFPALVADPVSTLQRALFPLSTLQLFYIMICLPTSARRPSLLPILRKAPTSKLRPVKRPLSAKPPTLSARIIHSTLSLLFTLLLATPFFTIALILFGGPLTTHLAHNALCAAHMALLALPPLFYVYGIDGPMWHEILSASLPFDEVWGGTVGTVVGAWLGAVPIPLDWDREWQKWPVTIVTGAYLGWFVGRLAGGPYMIKRLTLYMFYFILLLAVGFGALADTRLHDSNLYLDNTLPGFSPLNGEELGSNRLVDDDTLSAYNIQEVESDGPLLFDTANPEFDLDIPRDDDWLSSSGIFSEQGSCPSNSPPSRKIRKSEESCRDVDPANIILQLPNVGDISQELVRQKLCSKSQRSTFGNIPVCLEMNRQATPMSSWSSWLIANMDSLETPLTGWMVVPGTLYISDDTCESGLVYCCNAFLPHRVQYPNTPFSLPEGWGYWCVPGIGEGP